MSFSRSPALEAQATNVHRSEDPEYSDDPEYKRFTESLSGRLFALTKNISQLGTQVSYLGTKRESERVREKVQDLVESTGSEFKEIGEGLKRASAWPDLGPAQRFTLGKLNKDFSQSIAQFQNLQRQALQKQRAANTALELEREQSSESQQRSGSQLQQQQQQQQQESRLAPQSEVDFQSSLIIEREAEIRQIEQSVGELNELFQDVATMINEQGEQLDTIGDNVQRVNQDTRGADTELRAAHRYQKNARNKACCLLIVLAIVLVIVILAVVLS